MEIEYLCVALKAVVVLHRANAFTGIWDLRLQGHICKIRDFLK